MYDLIIIGAGPAGLTAAIYSVRYNLNTLVLANSKGTLSEAHMVENWPGFVKSSGLEIMKKIEEHVKSLGVSVKNEEVNKIEKKNNFKIYTKNNNYETKSVILAVGTKRRKLNLPDEEKYLGKGISYCYTCDAPLMNNKVTAVVGGSNAAAFASLLLSEYAKKVYILYRKNELKAEPILVDQIKKNKKIEIMYNTEVKSIKGSKFLESIKLNNNKELKVEGLFVEIGSVPSLAFIKDLNLNVDKEGYIIVNESRESNVKGFFAAGDITNTSLRQGITAAGDGAKAAFSAYKYCKSN